MGLFNGKMTKILLFFSEMKYFPPHKEYVSHYKNIEQPITLFEEWFSLSLIDKSNN